jgi:hypothetical protein
MLTLEDFETIQIASESLGLDLHGWILSKEELQKSAEMCIMLAKLSVCIGGILTFQFSLLPPKNSQLHSVDKTGDTTTLLFAKSHWSNCENVQRWDQELQTWYLNRPPSCIYDPETPRAWEGSDPRRVQRAFLHMLFFSVVSALYRPLLHSPGYREASEHRVSSEEKVNHAAMEIAKVSSDLQCHNLTQYGPPIVSMLQLPAVITHLRRCQLSSERRAQEVLVLLFPCLRVVEDCRERYGGADLAMVFILDVMKKSNIVPQFGRDSQIIGLHYNGHTYQPDVYHLKNWFRSVATDDLKTPSFQDCGGGLMDSQTPKEEQHVQPEHNTTRNPDLEAVHDVRGASGRLSMGGEGYYNDIFTAFIDWDFVQHFDIEWDAGLDDNGEAGGRLDL